MATRVQPFSASHAASSSRPAVVGGEGADLAGDPAAGDQAHGGDHGRLVDVEAGAAGIEDLHGSLLSASRRRGALGEVWEACSGPACRPWHKRGCSKGPGSN